MQGTQMFCAHNIFYCSDYLETKSQELCDEIMVPMHYFHTLMSEFDQEEVLYITVRNTVNTLTYLATIGVPHEGDEHTVYMPQWMMDALGVTETTVECIELEKTSGVGLIPVATKIVLREPAVEIDDSINVCELVEKAMVNLHSIQQGMELPIWVLDMEVSVYIERVEPGAVSRIIAGEVEVEFTATTNATATMNANAMPSPIYIPDDHLMEDSYAVPSVPRASSLPIVNAWDYHDGEERQKYIREARMKRFS